MTTKQLGVVAIAAGAVFDTSSAFTSPSCITTTAMMTKTRTRTTTTTSTTTGIRHLSSVPRFFEDELGAQPPLGFFDPLGIVADGDEQKFNRLRYVEIKHGRICMLGVVGYLTTAAGIRWPSDGMDETSLSFESIPGGLDALEVLPKVVLFQLVALIGFFDLVVMRDVVGGEFVGDFRNGFLDFGWDTFDDETKMVKRAIELNQGRAAMMGMLGLMVHDGMGSPLVEEVY